MTGAVNRAGGPTGWWRSRENHRWQATAPSSRPSITVYEQSKEDRETAEKRDAEKLAAGAVRVPFGFGRALLLPVAEPLLWEGDGA